jgi:hypothetical protein
MANANYPVNSAGSAAFVTTVSAFVFAFMIPICNAGGFVQPVIVAVLAGALAEATRRRTIRKLVASLDQTDAHAILEVYLNGAKVGAIAAIDVLSLKLDALRDPRNYAAQVANVFGFACRGALAALAIMPLFLFWLCVGEAWLAPASFLASMSAIAHLQAADLTRFASQLTVMTQIIFICVIGASFSFGIDLGLDNLFRRAVHREIRRKLNCASEGSLDFSPAPRARAQVQPA